MASDSREEEEKEEEEKEENNNTLGDGPLSEERKQIQPQREHRKIPKTRNTSTHATFSSDGMCHEKWPVFCSSVSPAEESAMSVSEL
jgi:hypothetical protein